MKPARPASSSRATYARRGGPRGHLGKRMVALPRRTVAWASRSGLRELRAWVSGGGVVATTTTAARTRSKQASWPRRAGAAARAWPGRAGAAARAWPWRATRLGERRRSARERAKACIHLCTSFSLLQIISERTSRISRQVFCSYCSGWHFLLH